MKKNLAAEKEITREAEIKKEIHENLINHYKVKKIIIKAAIDT